MSAGDEKTHLYDSALADRPRVEAAIERATHAGDSWGLLYDSLLYASEIVDDVSPEGKVMLRVNAAGGSPIPPGETVAYADLERTVGGAWFFCGADRSGASLSGALFLGNVPERSALEEEAFAALNPGLYSGRGGGDEKGSCREK